MTRRTFLRVGTMRRAIARVRATDAISAAWAQDKWPSRRVTIVVPFAAGSNTDACARLLAEQLRDIYDQPFIVENRGGAGGTLGANVVAKSAARRLHAAHGRQHIAVRRAGAVQERALRSDQGFHCDRPRRPFLLGDRCDHAAAVPDHSGVRGLRKGQSRQAELWPRQQHRLHRRRGDQEAHRHRHGARALHGDARRHHRPCRRPDPDGRLRPPLRRAADPSRQAHRTGDDLPRTQFAPVATCRHCTRP